MKTTCINCRDYSNSVHAGLAFCSDNSHLFSSEWKNLIAFFFLTLCTAICHIQLASLNRLL